MFEIKGKNNTAVVFAEKLENSAIGQLRTLCDMDFVAGSKIRIMPDAHAGAGCVVGTTMTIKDSVVPNLVGYDIGCGMEAVLLGDVRIDFNKLDKVIRANVPSGFSLRKTPHRFFENTRVGELTIGGKIKTGSMQNSIGSLGGGNHFIEVARDSENGGYWLIVHSGSRNPGLQVALAHQDIAGAARTDNVPFELAFLSGDKKDAYLHDMEIMQDYAAINRKAIVDEILKGMKWKALDEFTTIHNYVDMDDMILRKGAVSAKKGERLLIPMNMRDGSVICEGLGNDDWNYSCPHGAGRLYSRKDAKEHLTLTDFKTQMEGIFSTCVTRKTIDESPGAYKPMEEILDQIGPSAKISRILKPVYNFKAGTE